MGSTEAPRVLKVVVMAAVAAAVAVTSWVAASDVQQAKETEGTFALLAMPLGLHAVAAIDLDEDEFYDASEWGRVISQDALDEFLVTANAEGAQAAAITRSSSPVTLQAADAAAGSSAGPSVELGVAAGVAGEWDWDAVLADGSAPSNGEVAVPATAARALGLGLGDDVTVSYESHNDEAGELTSIGTRTIGALTYDSPDVPDTAVFLGAQDPGLLEMREAGRTSTSGQPDAPLTADVVWQRTTAATMATFTDPVDTAVGNNGVLIALWVGLLFGLIAVAVVTVAALATRAVPTPTRPDNPGWWARRTAGDLGALAGLAGATIGIGGVMLAFMVETRNFAAPIATGVPVTPLLPLALLAVCLGTTWLSFLQIRRVRGASARRDGSPHSEPRGPNGAPARVPVSTSG